VKPTKRGSPGGKARQIPVIVSQYVNKTHAMFTNMRSRTNQLSCAKAVNWDNIITIRGANIPVVSSRHHQPRVCKQVGPIFKNFVKIKCENKSEIENNFEQLKVKLHSCVLNARSVCNKSCEIYELLSDNSLDLLFVTETWLHQDGNGTVIHDMLPDGYKILHQPRTGCRGGGIAAIHRDNMQVDQVSDNTIT
jgi:hypothetical protein